MKQPETGSSDEACLDIRIADVLDYRAPFLIEKLVKNCVADTVKEAEELFQELKKYLILSRSDETPRWQMYSSRVDEVWHQFILYTEAYTTFCESFFGGYVGHSPSNAPEL